MNPFGLMLPWLPAMGLLILASAFFSGSEAALFSLQSSKREALPNDGPTSRRLKRLLRHPERLLSAVLFWNLVINMAYFAIAALVGTRLRAIGESGMAILFSISSLLLIIFFSEMLPKSIAVLNATTISQIVSRPLNFAVRIVSPVLPLLSITNRIAQRIVWPGFRAEGELSIDDIDRAIQLSSPDDAFADRERMVLRRLVSLADIRVSEWMRPRSQYQTHQFPISMETLRTARSAGYLFIGPDDNGEVQSVIAVRWLRPSHIDDLASACESPLIVPWSTDVATVFDLLRNKNRKIAAVVNEYGETIGVLSIDDILNAVLTTDTQPPPNRSITGASSQNTIRVSGAMSARELAKRLDLKVQKGKNVTVAGLIQSLRRRIPRKHDRCVWNGHTLTVIEESDDGSIEIEVSPVVNQEGES